MLDRKWSWRAIVILVLLALVPACAAPEHSVPSANTRLLESLGYRPMTVSTPHQAVKLRSAWVSSRCPTVHVELFGKGENPNVPTTMTTIEGSYRGSGSVIIVTGRCRDYVGLVGVIVLLSSRTAASQIYKSADTTPSSTLPNGVKPVATGAIPISSLGPNGTLRVVAAPPGFAALLFWTTGLQFHIVYVASSSAKQPAQVASQIATFYAKGATRSTSEQPKQ